MNRANGRHAEYLVTSRIGNTGCFFRVPSDYARVIHLSRLRKVDFNVIQRKLIVAH